MAWTMPDSLPHLPPQPSLLRRSSHRRSVLLAKPQSFPQLTAPNRVALLVLLSVFYHLLAPLSSVVTAKQLVASSSSDTEITSSLDSADSPTLPPSSCNEPSTRNCPPNLSRLSTPDDPSVTPSTVIKVGCIIPGPSAPMSSQVLRAVQLATTTLSSLGDFLPGHSLSLLVANTSSDDPVHSLAAVYHLLSQGVTAIVGPRLSSQVQAVAALLAAVQVPAVSFGASNPAISSSSEYEYVLRTVHSEAVELRAMVDIVKYYGWLQVIIVSEESDEGEGRIALLTGFLETNLIRLRGVIRIPLGANFTTAIQQLVGVRDLEPTVFLAPLTENSTPNVFHAAAEIGLFNSGYAWIVGSSSLSAVSNVLDEVPIDGLIGVRVAAPELPRSWWEQVVMPLQPSSASSSSSSSSSSSLSSSSSGSFVDMRQDALFAYDAVTLVLHGLRSVLTVPLPKDDDAGDLTSGGGGSANGSSSNSGGGSSVSGLAATQDKQARSGVKIAGLELKASAMGQKLLQAMLSTTFDGVTGRLHFSNVTGDRTHPILEVINLVLNRRFRTLGYWTPVRGLSVSREGPENSFESIEPNPDLKAAIWPGSVPFVPKGWVPRNQAPMRLAVPYEQDFLDMVNANNGSFTGLCIEVFRAAAALVPHTFTYELVRFGDGNTPVSYTEMIRSVANGTYDGAVGDITVTELRQQLVDYTAPFAFSSLAFAVPQKQEGVAAEWSFFAPFTASMWVLLFSSIIFTAFVVWFLERLQNPEMYGYGRITSQVIDSLWYAWTTIVFSQDKKIYSTLGRIAMMWWLFVVLIVTSSYTASLSSIFTVQSLVPYPPNLATALRNGWMIGYQSGSFMYKYLLSIGIPAWQLYSLDTLEDYATVLSSGKVVGVIDESPYLQLFTSRYCSYAFVKEHISNFQWAFAFQKGNPIVEDLSAAIAKLSASGQLDSLLRFWVQGSSTCDTGPSVQVGTSLGPEQFWTLFVLYGVIAGVCCLIYLALYLLNRYARRQLAKNAAARESPEKISERESSSNTSSPPMKPIGQDQTINILMEAEPALEKSEALPAVAAAAAALPLAAAAADVATKQDALLAPSNRKSQIGMTSSHEETVGGMTVVEAGGGGEGGKEVSSEGASLSESRSYSSEKRMWRYLRRPTATAILRDGSKSSIASTMTDGSKSAQSRAEDSR